LRSEFRQTKYNPTESMLSLPCTLVLSHVTLNPNFGAFSGGYFHTTLRVPHGARNLHTVRLEIDVPHGILVTKPEIPDGWSGVVRTRSLRESEVYSSHGNLKTTAPHMIVLEADTHADGVHDDNLLNVDMQLKIGCIFDDVPSNSVWNQAYTLWWRTKQVCQDDNGTTVILWWNGTQSDKSDGTSPSWSALPEGMLPSPYMYIEPGTRCSVDHSGEEKNGGMSWFGSYMVEETAPVTSFPVTTTMQWCNFIMALVALVLATASSTLLCALSTFRLKRKKQFAQYLLGDPVEIKEIQTGTM